MRAVSLASLERDGLELIGHVRAQNLDDEQTITMRWIYVPEERAAAHSSRHAVRGKSSWRTWSRLSGRRVKGRVGPWRLEVRAADGAVLALREFAVTP